MLNTSTIEILQKLDKKTLNKFISFARSPYLNSIEILIKMTEEVAKCHPEFNSPKLSYENMWKRLYPGKPYNDKIIRNLYTSHSKLLRKFIGYEYYDQKPEAVELDVISGLAQRDIVRQSNKLIEAAKKEKEGNFIFGSDSYYYLYKLGSYFFSQLDYIRFHSIDEYYKAEVFRSDNFIAYTLVNILASCGEYRTMKKNYRYNKEDIMLEKFLSSFDAESFLSHLEKSNHPYFFHIKIRYLFYKYAGTGLTREQFRELRELTFSNMNSFEFAESLTYLYDLQNILYTHLISKSTGYTNELFDMAKDFCALKICTTETRPYIALYTVRNFFTVALLHKEYEWADNFIEEYVNYLKPGLRENEYNYSKAIISFKLKKYNESLDFINKFQTTDILEKINIRLYSLMNYIELGAHEAAVSMIASIRQFTSESREIPPAKEESLQNSLKYFSELVKCIAGNKKLDYAILKEAFAVPKFFQKQYIYEKMETMV